MDDEPAEERSTRYSDAASSGHTERRAGAQAAKLRVSVNGRVRMDELICDGAILATPVGSTAYNYSAGGPILPLGSDVLAMTAIAPFRPRRWRGRSCRNPPWCGSTCWSR